MGAAAAAVVTGTLRIAAVVALVSGAAALSLVVIGVVIWHAASRVAFRVPVRLPAAEPPRHPVLFINPWSGGGKAAKVGLVGEAAGSRSVELRRGDDLAQLVRPDRFVDGIGALLAIASGRLPTSAQAAG